MMNTMQYDKPESMAYIQNVFTGHIRDPENQPAPADVDDSRMQVYRDAIYLNVERMVSNFFPVLKKTYTDVQWNELVRDYLKFHRSHVPPLLPMLGKEFLLYLQQERNLENDPVYILELAHYEWISFTLSIDKRDIELDEVERNDDFLHGIPFMSQLALPLCYRFPVHRIGPEFKPEEVPEQPTYLIVYRDINYKIGFMELNAVSAKLVEKIQQGKNKTGLTLLAEIAEELSHIDPEFIISGGLEILNQFYDKGVLLGTRKIENNHGHKYMGAVS